MQAFIMKTLVTMRGKTITTLFMNVLKHSRCMEQSNPIVLLFRVVLKQLNQTPEIGGAINWSVWVVALHHYHHWSFHSLHGWLITSCSDAARIAARICYIRLFPCCKIQPSVSSKGAWARRPCYVFCMQLSYISAHWSKGGPELELELESGPPSLLACFSVQCCVGLSRISKTCATYSSGTSMELTQTKFNRELNFRTY